MASASFFNQRSRKESEIGEICHTLLGKLPRAYSRDYIQERVKKIGGATAFNNCIVRELELLSKLVTSIKRTLTNIRAAADASLLGDCLTPDEVEAADALYHNWLPNSWRLMAGSSAPPPTYSVTTYLTDLQSRCQHLERILVNGKEKMPAYWLGAFFNPLALLAIFKQEAYVHQAKHDRSGNLDTIVFQTEITSRDKEHLRDPPQDGIFVYGFFLWNCAWDKTSSELNDSPPRNAYTSLPVVHLTCWTVENKISQFDAGKATETFNCPVLHSRHLRHSGEAPIMELDLHHEGISASRWALRGVMATLRPY